ncbi:MAG: hypothetical protein WBQ43_17270 [Terriglobales bacterium]
MVVQFEAGFERARLQRCRKHPISIAALQTAEKLDFVFGWRSGLPVLVLPLGGAAVYRCDKCLIFQCRL